MGTQKPAALYALRQLWQRNLLIATYYVALSATNHPDVAMQLDNVLAARPMVQVVYILGNN